jgi:hypothetical protein
LSETVDDEVLLLLNLAKYSFLRLDGAWFLAVSERFGVEIATELDVRAWETFSERLGKKIIATLNLGEDVAEILPQVVKLQNRLMSMQSEVTVLGPGHLILRVPECEVWKMVSKVWDSETAPCYKVTQASIRGLLRGAFPDLEFEITQNQLIPKGDPCCEVEIKLKATDE